MERIIGTKEPSLTKWSVLGAYMREHIDSLANNGRLRSAKEASGYLCAAKGFVSETLEGCGKEDPAADPAVECRYSNYRLTRAAWRVRSSLPTPPQTVEDFIAELENFDAQIAAMLAGQPNFAEHQLDDMRAFFDRLTSLGEQDAYNQFMADGHRDLGDPPFGLDCVEDEFD